MKGNGILFQIVLTKCENFFSKDWGKCLRYVTWPIYTNFCGLNFTFTKIGTMKMPIGTNNKYVETYRKKDSTTINDGCSAIWSNISYPMAYFVNLPFFWFSFDLHSSRCPSLKIFSWRLFFKSSLALIIVIPTFVFSFELGHPPMEKENNNKKKLLKNKSWKKWYINSEFKIGCYYAINKIFRYIL